MSAVMDSWKNVKVGDVIYFKFVKDRFYENDVYYVGKVSYQNFNEFKLYHCLYFSIEKSKINVDFTFRRSKNNENFWQKNRNLVIKNFK